MATSTKVPRVRMAHPKGRPIQLRYTDPESGKEIRITTGTHSEEEAGDQKKALEAKLLLGIDAKPRRRAKAGPSMDWQDFRERYYELELYTHRAAAHAETRLDIVERILKPRTLADVANTQALHELQQRLLKGDAGRIYKGEKQPRPRSKHTVRGIMAVVMAALNWAEYQEFLSAVPRVKRISVSKAKHMKGRAISLEEFERMLAATKDVVGEDRADSWKYLLRGLWEGALRLNELLNVHWTDAAYIQPHWQRGCEPVLNIPHEMQKNDTEEAIPLLPGFEAVLLETPEAERKGWAFNPLDGDGNRASLEWTGKVITAIGTKAGVVVVPAKGARKAKFASAHDLRRGCATRLVNAGLSIDEAGAILRHQSSETTRKYYAERSLQKAAASIRERLSVPRYTDASTDGHSRRKSLASK